jgi:hypothetical protein
LSSGVTLYPSFFFIILLTFKGLNLQFPASGFRIALVDNEATARALFEVPFEQYIFLEDYEAICSVGEGFIEANVSGIDHQVEAEARKRLFGLPASPYSWNKDATRIDILQSDGSGRKVSLIPPPGLRLGQFGRHYSQYLCLRIEGASFGSQDQAVTLLESVADALFFEIDVRFDITLGLRRDYKRQIGPLCRSDELSRKPLQFPEYRYDKQPISLYWYARRGLGMPLLQFLAFYQTIEYYFPMYSRTKRSSAFARF